MNKKTRRIIQRINDSVPQELRDRLMTEVYVAPDLRLQVRETVKEMWEAVEEMPDGPMRETAKKEAQRLQNVIDAGFYDTKELRVDPEVAKQIDDYVSAELDKAIAEGRIPHPKNDRDYQRYQRKLRQHEKRNQKKAEGGEEPTQRGT